MADVDFYTGELPTDLTCECGEGNLYPSFWGGLRCFKCNFIFDPETKEKILCLECGSPAKACAMGLYDHSCDENRHSCSYRRVVADVELTGGPDCQMIDLHGSAMYSSIEKSYKPFVWGEVEINDRANRLRESKLETEQNANAKNWYFGIKEIIGGDA